MAESPEAIGVVGAGVMGRDIAGLFAAANRSVTLVDVDPAALDDAMDALDTTVSAALRDAGYDVPTSLTKRVTGSTAVGALADAEFVVEAVPDRLSIKREVAADLEDELAADAVIGTNTSSLTAHEVGASLAHPERVVLFHFANPAIDRRLIEIAGDNADAAALATARGAGEAIGKPPVELDRERRGNGLSRLSAAIKCAASWELREQEATAIERSARAIGFDLGPFALIDRIGLDVHLATVDNLAVDHGDRFDPPASVRERLEEMVDRGDLGRKTGRGFFDWDGDGLRLPATDETAALEPVLAALVSEAHRIVADGVADRDRVDTILRRGSGGEVGPFDIQEMLGLERVRDVLAARYDATGATIYDPGVVTD